MCAILEHSFAVLASFYCREVAKVDRYVDVCANLFFASPIFAPCTLVGGNVTLSRVNIGRHAGLFFAEVSNCSDDILDNVINL